MPPPAAVVVRQCGRQIGAAGRWAGRGSRSQEAGVRAPRRRWPFRTSAGWGSGRASHCCCASLCFGSQDWQLLVSTGVPAFRAPLGLGVALASPPVACCEGARCALPCGLWGSCCRRWGAEVVTAGEGSSVSSPGLWSVRGQLCPGQGA